MQRAAPLGRAAVVVAVVLLCGCADEQGRACSLASAEDGAGSSSYERAQRLNPGAIERRDVRQAASLVASAAHAAEQRPDDEEAAARYAAAVAMLREACS